MSFERPCDRQPIDVHIRWMIRRDMPEVLQIEQASFEFPWDEDDFVYCLRQKNHIAMVAENNNDEIVGFMIYELHKTRLHLLDFAVHPAWRRRRVGTAMICKMTGKLSQQQRVRITVEVRESNVPAQLFFRNQGFRAVSVLRNFYDDTPEDAYLMQYRYQPPKSQLPQKTRRTRLG